MAQCYATSKEAPAAIDLYSKVLEELPDHAGTRIDLACLLRDNGEYARAVSVLSPPKACGNSSEPSGSNDRPWWQDGTVRKTLAELQYSQGKYQLYVDTLLPAIQETLCSHSLHAKGRSSKRLSKTVLLERSKWLEERPPDEVFHGFRPVLSSADTVKAARARRTLGKLSAEKEEKKAAALAAGLGYDSKDDSEEDLTPETSASHQAPLPNLLRDEEHYQLLLLVCISQRLRECCKTLASLKRYWEALETIQHVLQVRDGLNQDQRDELRTLVAQISVDTRDAKYEFDCVRHAVLQQQFSQSAWNRYYQVISRVSGVRRI